MSVTAPRVSVVIIFLNGERYLDEAIASVVAQSFHDWELILVDDGSTDASTAIALTWVERDPSRIRYLDHDGHANRGMSASRNAGLRLTRGEFVAFLDADDVWLPHKLARQVDIMAAPPGPDMVYGATEYWYSWTGAAVDLAHDHVPELGVVADTRYPARTLTSLLHPLGSGTAPCPSDLMVRRDFANRIGGFEERFVGDHQLFEDQAFLAKVYLHGEVHVSSETWDRYRIHPDSCSSSVAARGKYGMVRADFLNWLASYLQEGTIHEPVIDGALAAALISVPGPTAASPWTIRLGDGQWAQLEVLPDRPEAARVVSISDAAHPYDVQLNLAGYAIAAGERYRLRFDVRADQPRVVGAGISRAHDPWDGLGWYQTLEASTEWQQVSVEFTAVDHDHSARIHLDLGGSTAAIEVDRASLTRAADEEPIPRQPAQQALNLGDLRRLTPVSSSWGFDRGTPIDRHYIEDFLHRQAADIRGRVLEIEDNAYTRRFGGSAVTASDILHVTEGNPRATLVGDLADGDHLPGETFDCIVFTQTLQLIYDTRRALATLHRMLRPGGVLLATFPGLTRNSCTEWEASWFWGFTAASASRLFSDIFGPGKVAITSHGNVLTAVAFLHGLATSDLTPENLAFRDPEYDLLITVRAER